MRWLLLLSVTTCCMAQPVILLGTSPKEVVIYTKLYDAYDVRLTTADAILIGVVTSSKSQVHQSPAQITLEEDCILRIEAMYGHLAALEGATSVRFQTSWEHDKYQQLEPDWGTYRHLKEGQKVVALINDRDGPETSNHGVFVIPEAAATLPDILRRTGSDASRFTPADLVVLKAASPLFHDEVVMIANVMADMRHKEAAALNKLVAICVLLAFGGILAADHLRRQRYSARL